MQRMMCLELPEPQLRDLLIRQLSSLYFISDEEVEVLEDVLPEALRRCEVCFFARAKQVLFGRIWAYAP